MTGGKLLAAVITVTAICKMSSAADPCTEYEILRESSRDVNKTFNPSSAPLCDFGKIRQGSYYRFTGNGSGTIPDFKVPTYSCGTVIPIYLTQPHPVLRSQSKMVACASSGSGCHTTFDIDVKFCPQNGQQDSFFVYRLAQVPYCDVAYCAKFYDTTQEPETTIAPPTTNTFVTDDGGSIPEVINSIEISCTNNEFRVRLNETQFSLEFPDMDPTHLVLGEAHCMPSPGEQGEILVWSSTLQQCDTRRRVDENNIYYMNKLVDQWTEGNIIRDITWSMNVTCQVKRDLTVDAGYEAKDTHMTGLTKLGKGNFTLSMAFYDDEQYEVPLTDTPVTIKLNHRVYVKVKLNATDDGLKIVMEDTLATPSTDAKDSNHHTLISNRCGVDQTLEIYPSNDKELLFSFKAFKFIEEHPSVFLHSFVLLCTGDENSQQCSRECATSDGHHLTKRSAGLREVHRVYNGPMTLEGASAIHADDNSQMSDGYYSMMTSPIMALTVSILVVGILIAVAIGVMTKKLLMQRKQIPIANDQHIDVKYSRL